MLDIIALSYNDLPPVVPVRGVIPDEGGTIGRDAENALVLPDPARLVSRKHGRFFRDGDAYMIANISDGNPFVVNDQDVPAGATRRLSDGDLLQIGGYVLRIRFPAEQALVTSAYSASEAPGVGAADLPFGDGLPPRAAPIGRASPAFDLIGGGSSGALPGPFDDLLGTPVAPPKEFLRAANGNSSVSNPARSQIIPADFDPFGAAALQRQTVVAPDQLDSNDAGLDVVMPKLSAFSVVDGDPDISAVHCSDILAPEGIQLTLAVDQESHDPLLLFTDPSRSSPLLEALNSHSAGVPSMEAATDFAAAFRAPVAQSGPAEVVAPAQTKLASDQLASEPTVVATTADGLVEAQPAADGEPSLAPSSLPADGSAQALRAELKRAFEEGFCAELPVQAGEFGPETLRLIGALLRISIVGTLDLMRARAVVKKEIRVAMTVIEPNDNNPLKFSPDVDIAVQYLFGRKYPGFLGPTAAMAEAYSDLSAHQTGMVAGMRSAMEDIIHRFDPAKIQTEVVAKGLLSKISPMRGRARYWDAYCARYQGIADALGHDFQDFYAKAFTRAYEDEIGSRPEANPPP